MQVVRLAVIISAKTNLKGMTVKKTLSRKQRFFNKINLTTDDEVYVGIDVHKKNCHIAVRLHNQLRDKRGRIKHQIKSLLLQHNIPEPDGLDDWTKQSIVQLRNIKLCPQLRFTLGVMLDELNYLLTQIKRVQRELKNIYSKEHHSRQMEILQSHPGVGPITARQFRAEVFSPERFDKPTQLTRDLIAGVRNAL